MFELEETESIEFKRELNESLKKELVAFANTHGGEVYNKGTGLLTRIREF